MGIIYSQSEDQVFEDARIEIKAQMDAMAAAMAADDPKPEVVYDNHFILKVSAFPAISIDIEGATQNEDETVGSYGAGAVVESYVEIIASIRVLMNWNYEGAYFDSLKFWRLANSIKNWMLKNRPLNNNFNVSYIDNFSVNENFPESLTIGGSVTIKMIGIRELALI